MNITKTCKTCKHWAAPTDALDIALYGAHFGTCDSPKFIYAPTAPHTRDAFLYLDYEGYGASIRSGADFGCIHHKYARRKDVK